MKQFSESALNMQNKANQSIEKFGKSVEAPFNLLTKRHVGGRKNKKTRRGGGLMSMASKIKDRAKEGATNLLDSAYKRTLEEHDNIVFKVKVFGMLVATKDTEITYMMEKIGTKDEVAGSGTDPKKKTWFEIYEIDPPRSQILPSAVAPGTPNAEGTPKTEGTQSTVPQSPDVTKSEEASNETTREETTGTTEEGIPVETSKNESPLVKALQKTQGNVSGESPIASLNKALTLDSNSLPYVENTLSASPGTGTNIESEALNNVRLATPASQSEKSPPTDSFSMSMCTIS
jgi:hypothetical protein